MRTARGTRVRGERIEAQIDAELYVSLEECARAEGVTVEDLTQRLVKDGLKRMLGKK